MPFLSVTRYSSIDYFFHFVMRIIVYIIYILYNLYSMYLDPYDKTCAISDGRKKSLLNLSGFSVVDLVSYFIKNYLPKQV